MAGPDDRHVRPFAEFLHEQRNGLLHAEVSDALNELLDAVLEHGKAGALSLTIAVKPAGSGDGTVFVTDEVRVKAPKGERPAALFFVDDDRNLSRNNPRQLSFEGLREVPRPAIPESPKEATNDGR